MDSRLWSAGNSINLVQLTKRANKMGYHTYVGKGMVLICAAPDTKGKLREDSCPTVRHIAPLCFQFVIHRNAIAAWTAHPVPEWLTLDRLTAGATS